MQLSGYGLLRILLPRIWVNRGKKEQGRGCYAPALLARPLDLSIRGVLRLAPVPLIGCLLYITIVIIIL